MLYKLHSLGTLVRIDAGGVVARLGTIFLGKGRRVFDLVFGGTVKFFLENRLLVNCLELGLEVVESLSAAVRSSAGVIEVEFSVFDNFGDRAPAMRISH